MTAVGNHIPGWRGEWYSSASFEKNAEDDMKRGVFLAMGTIAIGTVAMGGLLLLAGCGSSGNKPAGIPAQPKWKGAPYRLAFDAKAAKPRPDGINIPAVKFTANPDAIWRHAPFWCCEFTAAGTTNSAAAEHLMIGTGVDIKGDEGTLPEDYMDLARKGLAGYLETYCVKGKVDLSVALARSSLSPQAGIDDVDPKLPVRLAAAGDHVQESASKMQVNWAVLPRFLVVFGTFSGVSPLASSKAGGGHGVCAHFCGGAGARLYKTIVRVRREMICKGEVCLFAVSVA
jgi:hypothetical protein